MFDQSQKFFKTALKTTRKFYFKRAFSFPLFIGKTDIKAATKLIILGLSYGNLTVL